MAESARTAACGPATLREHAGPKPRQISWRQLSVIAAGLLLFAAAFVLPVPPPVRDHLGTTVALSREGQAALGLFLMAVLWWVSEVIPTGATSIAVGALQALFVLRAPRAALADFMDPVVWFVFGALLFGMVFAKTGLTRRLAYGILALAGERTRLLYLVCFALVGLLGLFMAHTTVAATVFPLFLAVHSLYAEGELPTRFGKGLFTGLAFSSGAASVATLLGSARALLAIGIFEAMTKRSVGFFEFATYMVPLGAVTILLVAGFAVLRYPPERRTISGLSDRVRLLNQKLGPLSRAEIGSLVIALIALSALGLSAVAPWPLDKSAVILCAVLLFFAFKILTLEDLEAAPWNALLLLGGALSLGLCLFQTGAAAWLAASLRPLCIGAHPIVWLLVFALVMLLAANAILNLAVIALGLPVALLVCSEVHFSPELILYTTLAVTGMPLLSLIGAAPTAIAYSSKQFKASELFWNGLMMSVAILGVLATFALWLWPAMGMPTGR